MNKYLVLENGKFNFGGDIVYVGESGGTLTLNYSDTNFALTGAGNFTAADKTAIEDALVKVWGQSYTNATINVTLSQGITGIVKTT